MTLWCTVVKPYEMSPRAVPSSLKLPFRVYQARYGGYPDASTTCWAARRRHRGCSTHIKGYGWSVLQVTYTSENTWATYALTQTSETRGGNSSKTYTLQRPWAMNWTSLTHIYTLQRHTRTHTHIQMHSLHIIDHDWTSANSLTNTYSLLNKQ